MKPPFSMVFPWFSHGFPVFPWFSYGFPMVFLKAREPQSSHPTLRQSPAAEAAEAPAAGRAVGGDSFGAAGGVAV